MEAINVLVYNYRETTKGLNIFTKIIFTLVLAFVFFAVISAFYNVLVNSFKYFL